MGYERSLAHYFDMSTLVGLPDLGVVGGNPGVGANIVGNPDGIAGGRCAEFNGNNSLYNLGDVAMLNAVPQFTIAFWMNQNVIGQRNVVFNKGGWGEANTGLLIHTDPGVMYFYVDGASQRGRFDYTAVVDARRWHHVVMVFNGAGTGNVGRLQVYVDAVPMVLTYDGTIPAATDDMVGVDMTMGFIVSAWNGELDSFGIFSSALTRLQVQDFKLATESGRL